jgi:hypothetical protein
VAFVRIPGKQRRYRDTDTGTIISRREYDQRHGRLAGTGLTLEKAAKKTREQNPILAEIRPARGRKKPEFLKQIAEEARKNRQKLQSKIRRNKKTNEYSKNKSVKISSFKIDGSLESILEAVAVAGAMKPPPLLFRFYLLLSNELGEKLKPGTAYISLIQTTEKISAKYDELISNYSFGNLESGIISFVFGLGD